MAVESVSNNFFQIAKEQIVRTNEKISSCVFAAKIFIMLAFFFNPWVLGTFFSLSAFAITVCGVANALIASGLALTVHFYVKNLLIRNDIRLQVSQKREECQNAVRGYANVKMEPTLPLAEPAFVFNSRPLIDFASQPVGLSNTTGANCWANALLQFLINNPRYAESIKLCPHKIGDSSLETIINQYEQDRRNRLSVSSANTQILREIVHMESPHFNDQGGAQEDAFEPFNILSDWLPKTQIRYETIYLHGSLNRPLENQNGNPFTFLENDTFSSSRIENEKNFSIELVSTNDPVELNALMDHYFEKENYGGEDRFRFLDSTYNITAYPILSREMKILSAPNDLCIHIKRFSVVNHITIKKLNDIIVPQKFTLKNQRHSLAHDAEYALDSFIVHSGSIGGGHYKAFINKNGRWYECNDSSITLISAETALQAAKQAYIIHYSKS